MGVEARNDSFVQTNYNKSCVQTTETYYTDGHMASSQYAFTATEHTCSRASKSKNRAVAIAGTSTKFKTPSSYSREVLDILHFDGKWEQVFTSGLIARKVLTGPANTLASLKQYAVPPCWGGGHQVTLDTNLRAQARTQAMQKLGDQKAQFGASLAEAKKTYNMIASRSLDLLAALRALKRGHRPKLNPWGDSRRLADGYLEFRYGWKPLMQDIHAGYELFREQLKPALIVKGSSTVPDHATIDGGGLNATYNTVGSAHRWHTCQVWGTLDCSLMRSLTQAGLTNPLSLGWEIVPYSFVVDWFMPVGAILEAHAARFGLTFLAGFDAVRSEGSCTATKIPSAGYSEVEPMYHEARHFGYRRWRLTSWPTLSLYAKQDPFNTSMAAAAAALFRQLLH